MIDFKVNTKCTINFTSSFKKQLKQAIKQGNDIKQLLEVVTMLADFTELDEKYRNHQLNNDRRYKNCYECHINPDWLLVYKYVDENLILLLVATGSHSELFK